MVLQEDPQLRPEQLGEGGAEQREAHRLRLLAKLNKQKHTN